MRFLCLLFATMVCASAQAQDAKQWGKSRSQDFGECRFVGAAAQIMGTVTPSEIQEAGSCVEGKLEGAKAGFQMIARQPAPAASAALKEFYAAWMSGMRSIPGLLSQPKDIARINAAATKQRLDELWARFEIEAGL